MKPVADHLQALVEFENVDKTYDGEYLAVNRLSLRIAKGEFLTFLGPSGSGKTTALMMLAGFEVPTAGEIRLDGRPVILKEAREIFPAAIGGGKTSRIVIATMQAGLVIVGRPREQIALLFE